MAGTKAMKQTRVAILWSLNMIILLMISILIFVAISMNGGIQKRLIRADSDISSATIPSTSLQLSLLKEDGSVIDLSEDLTYINEKTSLKPASIRLSLGNNQNELWKEDSITITRAADIDLCVARNLDELGEVYLKASNPYIISEFILADRYNTDTQCWYPVIMGTGRVTISGGTYDGTRYDQIIINVVENTTSDWIQQLFAEINQERIRNSLEPLNSIIADNLGQSVMVELSGPMVASPELAFSILRQYEQYRSLIMGREYNTLNINLEINEVNQPVWTLQFVKIDLQ